MTFDMTFEMESDVGDNAASDLKGAPTPPAVVVLERGPVSNFAKAVTDNNPIYTDARAAKAAGFEDVPIPPTYPFGWNHFGEWPELQPEGHDGTSPIMHAIGSLMKSGGLILHGEQEFTYHRLPVVGEKLRSEGRIADIYEKEGGSKMTFVVTDSDWYDEAGEKVLTARMTLLHKA